MALDARSPVPSAEEEELAAAVFADREALATAKARAEMAMEKSQQELRAATDTLEQQTLELNTLRGRATALKAASDAAAASGSPLGRHDLRRFNELPKSGDAARSVASEDLRELLDLAIIATSRRVNDALAQAAWARSESERACEAGNAGVEQAFLPHDPGRTAARALLVQLQRSAAKLRSATQKLEDEAASAQTTHAADVRSLSARLIAQRDAAEAILLKELTTTETEGELSIRASSRASTS